jgi:urease accessory protein
MNKKAFGLLLLASPAAAHVGLSHVTGFASGFTHPLSGLDHLAAMIAVGLWAGQQGGKAQYIVPTAFVSTMVLGGMLGMAGVPMPGVECGIAASVLVLGLLTASALEIPTGAASGLVGLFALFHGYAHGAEMPSSAAGLEYGLGFVISTALLHCVGVGLAVSMQAKTTRYAGAAIALTGAFLLIK